MPVRDATCGKCNKQDCFVKVCLLTLKKVGMIMADDPEKQDEFYSDDTGFLLGVTGKQKGKKN